MALIALFLAFLGMFLVTSQNIKAEADDRLSGNTEIVIYGSDGTNYMISGKSGTYSNSYTVVGPMKLSIIADGGQFCGYFSSCVTLRGNYSYSGIGAGSYSIYVVDYYNSTSSSIDTYATYSISITVIAVLHQVKAVLVVLVPVAHLLTVVQVQQHQVRLILIMKHLFGILKI